MCRLHLLVLDSHLDTLLESNCPFDFLLVMFLLGSSYFVFVFLSFAVSDWRCGIIVSIPDHCLNFIYLFIYLFLFIFFFLILLVICIVGSRPLFHVKLFLYTVRTQNLDQTAKMHIHAYSNLFYWSDIS